MKIIKSVLHVTENVVDSFSEMIFLPSFTKIVNFLHILNTESTKELY
jgi:hypothetical protein